jgi:Rad3-related DNA helicase
MATFKRVQTPPTGPVDIETLFRDLPGRSDPFKYMWSHQADLLREYQSHLTASDVALELPTGSGKTLVGLLIAEYRRRREKARVVYLCPTRQLCHQVARQAKALGIPASTLVGKQKDYDPQEFGDYRTGASLAITTYNGIFNTNPRISDPQIIIVDDAHAADQYISSLWTVRIARDEQADLYAALLDLLADGLPDRALQRLRDDDADPDAKSLVDAAPYTTLFHSRNQIAELLDSRAGDSEKESWTYSWRKISGHLHACQAWLSWDEIVLRPYICPTLTHAPFSQASQRIYMSATLGAGGELERALGIPDIARLPIPTGWEKRGTGRRFFVFPERSLDAPGVDAVLGGVLALTPRSLGLSPSRTGAKFLASAVQRLRPGVTVVTADQVEDDLAPFTRANPAHLSLSGRYDGIDLAGDTCRFVVVNDLPGATDLVEQFFLTRLSAHALLRDRIRTRFTQAVGRCSRGDNDHSLVMVRGGRLLDYCSDPNFVNTLHPELQAEVRFGLENSEVDGPTTLVDLSAAFIKQSPDWLDAESSIRELRDQSSRAEDPSAAALRVTAKPEVRASYDLWNGHYENAVERCREVADQLPGEALKSYRSWWCYQAACAAVASNEAGAGTGYLSIARDYFVRAANGAPSVSWFMDMARKLPKDVSEQAQQLQRPEDILLAVQAENMLRYVESEGFTGKKFGTDQTSRLRRYTSS